MVAAKRQGIVRSSWTPGHICGIVAKEWRVARVVLMTRTCARAIAFLFHSSRIDIKTKIYQGMAFIRSAMNVPGKSIALLCIATYDTFWCSSATSIATFLPNSSNHLYCVICHRLVNSWTPRFQTTKLNQLYSLQLSSVNYQLTS